MKNIVREEMTGGPPGPNNWQVVWAGAGGHTSYLSREPRVYPCKFFLAGVNFYRFNAKNWQFTVYFVVIYAFFRCKFYSPKILLV